MITSSRVEGFAYLVGFALCIPVANWMIGNVGTVCVPDGPCLIPVAPGLEAPSGVLAVGVSLVLRDLVQRRLGALYALGAIVAGATLSAFIAPAPLIVASATAFLLSELADMAVYTPLHRRQLIIAVTLSGVVGLVVDSFVFLWLAFGSIDHLAGQIVGKGWAVIASLPAIAWIRRMELALEIGADGNPIEGR